MEDHLSQDNTPLSVLVYPEGAYLKKPTIDSFQLESEVTFVKHNQINGRQQKFINQSCSALPRSSYKSGLSNLQCVPLISLFSILLIYFALIIKHVLIRDAYSKLIDIEENYSM